MSSMINDLIYRNDEAAKKAALKEMNWKAIKAAYTMAIELLRTGNTSQQAEEIAREKLYETYGKPLEERYQITRKDFDEAFERERDRVMTLMEIAGAFSQLPRLQK